MIKIDGSYLEGGGSIVRIATALSTITLKPIEIYNIRLNRPKPGLKTQHIEGIKAISHVCNAKVSGVYIGSTRIKFFPNRICKHKVNIKISTAGSIGLVIQNIMIVSTCAEQDIVVSINGGSTNSKWAPSVNYIKHVLLPLLRKMGYCADIKIFKYGYYPRGCAKVKLEINVCDLKPLFLSKQGKLKNISAISHASLMLKTRNVVERQKISFIRCLKSITDRINVEEKYVNTKSIGSGLDAWITTENSLLGACGLGEKGKIAEDVGKETANFLLKQYNSKSPIDEYAADQLLPYISLAGKGKIKVSRITNHTRTNIWLIKQFLPVDIKINKNVIIVS